MKEISDIFGRLLGVLLAKNVITFVDFDFILTGEVKTEEQASCDEVAKSCDTCAYKCGGFCKYATKEKRLCINGDKWKPKQVDKTCESCRFVDLKAHQFPCSCCSKAYGLRWQLKDEEGKS